MPEAPAARKQVLLVRYSQSGRSTALSTQFCAPLSDSAGVDLHVLELTPKKPYPFPWGFFDFLDAFPETVQLEPIGLEPFALSENREFDLVIIAYTVWFLSPAPPVLSFLKSAAGKALIKGVPVVTLISCRNMWMQAHDIVSGLLLEAGARHCDNVVTVDPGPSLLTFISTPRWMLTGRRDAFWGIPAAGISDADIAGVARFGRALDHALANDEASGSKPMLQGLKAVDVDDRLLSSERIGRRSFLIWSRLIRVFGARGAPARKPALAIYSLFLVIMIITVVPLSLLVRRLLRPLQTRQIAAIHAHYAHPSGGDSSRMLEFTH